MPFSNRGDGKLFMCLLWISVSERRVDRIGKKKRRRYVSFPLKSLVERRPTVTRKTELEGKRLLPRVLHLYKEESESEVEEVELKKEGNMKVSL